MVVVAVVVVEEVGLGPGCHGRRDRKTHQERPPPPGKRCVCICKRDVKQTVSRHQCLERACVLCAVRGAEGFDRQSCGVVVLSEVTDPAAPVKLMLLAVPPGSSTQAVTEGQVRGPAAG